MFPSMRWFTSAKINNSACAKEPESGKANVDEWYGVQKLSSVRWSEHIIRSFPALHPSPVGYPSWHIQFNLNLFPTKDRGETDIKSVNCCE